jgi:hypothetical protein
LTIISLYFRPRLVKVAILKSNPIILGWLGGDLPLLMMITLNTSLLRSVSGGGGRGTHGTHVSHHTHVTHVAMLPICPMRLMFTHVTHIIIIIIMGGSYIAHFTNVSMRFTYSPCLPTIPILSILPVRPMYYISAPCSQAF